MAGSCCLRCGRGALEITDLEDLEYGTNLWSGCLKHCPACDLAFVDPRPDDATIGRLYDAGYYTVNVSSPLYLRGWIYQRKLALDVARWRKAIGGKSAPVIVDVGCGDAARLRALRRHRPDARAIGIDLQVPAEVRQRAESAGVELVEAEARHGLDQLPDGYVDLIVMSQLIEHVADPWALVRAASAKLAPAGRLLLETPNLGGVDYLLFRSRSWGGYHMPRHLTLFGRRGLRELVRSCGLVVETHGPLPSPGFWIISLRNALGLSSRARSQRAWEFLNFRNLLAVGLFTALDTGLLKLGFWTSNQYLTARPEAGAREPTIRH